ncbi:uncharacterized protein LOC120080842 [Benincasa hispida]|uniref:uncharacterized protein LOC120080842 n=1 Tax=Benincasa hispida TaxID=102211 RepID=UPI001900FCD0|nr:uncharacterized protein LOC120080842 [Benincasa hispida]
MCSSSSFASTFSLFLTKSPSISRRRNVISPNSHLFLGHLRPTNSTFRITASITERDLELSSWFNPDQPNGDDTYGGWIFLNSPTSVAKTEKQGLPRFLIGVVGTSLVVLFAVIAQISLSRRGFKFQWRRTPLRSLEGVFSRMENVSDEGKTVEDTLTNDDLPIESGAESIPDSKIDDSVTSDSGNKLERVILTVPVDSAQDEALSILKKLKVMEDDINAGELCSRREYARWLVRMYSSLERNPKHHIIPSVSLSGSTVAAFDDISFEDPDFESIQALAEAGIVPSKLSPNYGYDGLGDREKTYFFPERFVSRQTLIDWKAQLDYEFASGMLEQISSTKVDFMDLKEISSEASPQLFMDILAGERSILRKVFGRIKRFQPNKPSTKAQVAVTLASGRMTEAISAELSRLESESSARKAEIEDIKLELVERGDIQRYWDKKLTEEKKRLMKVEELYLAAVNDLGEEKIVQEKFFSEYLKEKTSIDCQRQLLLSLKEEVDGMTEKLLSERSVCETEQSDLHNMHADLQNQLEGMLDTKAVLEAEKEALRILRSWVEDEARKSQARAKVLEEVGRRWKWDDQA